MALKAVAAILLLAIFEFARAQTAYKVAYFPDAANWPLARLTDGKPEGFEVDVINALCKRMNSTCTLVPVTSLPDRLTIVESGKADFAVAYITVTEERKTVVDFVKPYYYSAGSAMFAPKDSIKSSNWGGLALQPVCIADGNVAIGEAEKESLVPIVLPANASSADFIESVDSGRCIGIMDDSTFAEKYGYPIVAVGLPPLNPSPYGIIVKKGNTALKGALTLATIGMMSQGENSEILALEENVMLANGVPVNDQLTDVVMAVSAFNVTKPACPSSGGVRIGAIATALLGASLAVML